MTPPSTARVWPTAIDPHEHAELLDGPAALAWQAAQHALTLRALEAWPHAGAVRELVAAVTPPPQPASVPIAGGVVRVGASAQGAGPRLTVEGAAGSAPRLLLDASERARRGEQLGLDYAIPSPDGHHLIVGIGPKGAETSTLQVLDVSSGHLHPLADSNAGRSVPAWLPDSSAFLYSAGLAEDGEALQRCVKEYSLGDAAPSIVDVDLRGRMWTQAQVSPRYAVVVVYEGNFHPRPWYVRAHDDPDGTWRPFLIHAEGEIRGEFVRDEYIAVELRGTSLGRLVAVPHATADDRDSWRELLPESHLALRGVRHLGGGLLLVSVMDDGVRSARLVRLDGTVVADVAAPGPGIAHFPVPEEMHLAPAVPEDTEAPAEFVFALSAFDRSAVGYAADTSTGQVRALTEPGVAVSGIRRRRVQITVDDGTPITVDLVHRDDADLSQPPRPALVWAYGGFNATGDRGYDPLSLAFVLSGGVVVLPHLRGGGERGWPWWRAGQRAHKQRTFDDLYAVAEHLLEQGLVERLGIHGASNGGLLAAVAVAQRPDLWAVAGSLVPVTDLRRITRDPWASFRCIPEFGDPDDPEQAAWMAGYSPYHAIRAGVEYPPTIVVAGTNDRRTFPWHARVFTAALQDAGATAHFFAVPDDGHFAILDPAMQHHWLGFYMRHLGMTPIDVAEVDLQRQG